LLGQRLEGRAQFLGGRSPAALPGEVRAHEEMPGPPVVELRELLDGLPIFHQKAGDGMHQAQPLRAVKRQDVLIVDRHGVPVLVQHSMTFTASPPRDVSLYLAFMSAPVSRMVLIAMSSDTRWSPSPASASRAALMALT